MVMSGGSLERSPADVLAHLLVDLSHGVHYEDSPSGNWPIFVGQQPNEPDSCITIYDTTGRTDGRMATNGQTVIQHGVEIMIRDDDYVDGWAKANAIVVCLDETIANNNVTVGDITGTGSSTYKVHAVSITGPINTLGTETPTSRRFLFTINALVVLRQTA